jgi:hypothetical protein
MKYSLLMSIVAPMAVATVSALTAPLAMAQGAKPAPAAKTWTTPKTPWGDPDLQGTWTSDDCIGTPLNRPANFGDRGFYTEQEIAQREKQLETQQQTDLQETVGSNARVGTGPPAHWGERARRPCRQTSLVVDPPNGRMPDLLPEARTRPIPEGAGNNNPKADSWEDFSYYIRCISRGVTGSIFPVIYGNGQQIVQGPGYVTIMQEMVHEARVIPLDGRPHAGQNIRSYMGDARGHWEGNTLVVETTNFTDSDAIGSNGAGYPGDPGHHSADLKLTERFTRVDANTLNYEATIDDPKTWTKPWTILIPLTRNDNYQLLEYACHEGNIAMGDILSGARADESKQGSK